jgi:hypothetical protein
MNINYYANTFTLSKILLFLIILYIIPLLNSYEIVRIRNDKQNFNNVYSLYNGVARLIEDNCTILILGGHPTILKEYHIGLLDSYKIGKPMDKIEYISFTPDDIIRVELAITKAFNGPELRNKQTICKECKNPATILWRDHTFICGDFGRNIYAFNLIILDQ